MPLSARLSRPATPDVGPPEPLAPLFDGPPSRAAWEARRPELLAAWRELIGEPALPAYDPTPEVVGHPSGPGWHGTLFRQPTGPDQRQLVLLMEPDRPPRSPRPGAVVPFYHPDAMAGLDLQTGTSYQERPVVRFGYHLVQQGYVVVCPEAFPFNTVPEPVPNVGFAWWEAAARKLLAVQPGWTGIGKLAYDTSRAVDLLLAQPDVDPARVVAIGHSLGGKMAFYTGALDPRLGAVIASDFGIGWDYTNWAAPWYLGERLAQPGLTLAHHQLLALLAPRSFFLIVGDTDRPASWQYLQAAQQVYALYDRRDAVGLFAHGTGHSPTEESLRLTYTWLAEQFDLPPADWTL